MVVAIVQIVESTAHVVVSFATVGANSGDTPIVYIPHCSLDAGSHTVALSTHSKRSWEFSIDRTGFVSLFWVF